MTLRNLYLESWSTNNGLLTPGNALSNVVGTWTTNTDNALWDGIAEFQNPSENHANGIHLVTVRARKDAGTSNPTLTCDVIDSFGAVMATSGAVSITSTTGQDININVDSTTLNAAGGGLNAIRLRLTAPATGGSPNARSVAQIDYAVWSGDFDTVSLSSSITVFNSGTELNADVYVWDGAVEVPITTVTIV